VNGLLFDVHLQGYVRYILALIDALGMGDVWRSFDLPIHSVIGLGHPQDVSDRVIWNRCQSDGLILITENRNDDGPDSLQRTMNELRTESTLPVLTLANRERFRQDRRYALIVVEEMLNTLADLEAGQHRGTDRLFLPPRPVI
jgi:hypothetical protein